MYRLVDTHAHLDEVTDLGAAIDNAKSAGVIAIIAVGINHESNLKTLEIAAKYPGYVYPALGLHPWDLGKLDSSGLARTLKSIEDNILAAVAIGEVGLDYHKKVRASADKDRQHHVFRAVLELAGRYDKPVLVHSRYAWKDSFDLVRSSGVKKAVFHWYIGLSSVLKEIVAAGYFVSAAPAGEYHEEHRRAIKEAPLDRLLLETDAPVQYGREVRYESRPADVLRSLAAAAALRGEDGEVIADQTTANARKLFVLPVS